MKKLYEKDETGFALALIGVYVSLMSAADAVSMHIGVFNSISAIAAAALTAYLYLFAAKNGLKAKYGLTKCTVEAKKLLYFIPFIALAATNIAFGLSIRCSAAVIILGIIKMLCVGFIEELIFRGFLFKALSRSSIKTAVIVSSLSFGLGHIVNLLSGHALPETLVQVCYAVAIGFVFTVFFLKTKSLWPCIFTHSAINSLSVISKADMAGMGMKLAGSLFLIAVSVAYAVYLLKAFPTERAEV